MNPGEGKKDGKWEQISPLHTHTRLLKRGGRVEVSGKEKTLVCGLRKSSLWSLRDADGESKHGLTCRKTHTRSAAVYSRALRGAVPDGRG